MSKPKSKLSCLKVKVLVAQSCLTPYDPMDWSLSGSSVPGIVQAKVLEWLAITRRSSRPRDRTWVSCFGRWATKEVPKRETIWKLPFSRFGVCGVVLFFLGKPGFWVSYAWWCVMAFFGARVEECKLIIPIWKCLILGFPYSFLKY